MAADAIASVPGLTTCSAGLRDPRVRGRCAHELLDIRAITWLAVRGGADDWPEGEVFGRTREEWLPSFLRLPNGSPSRDTFRRVFGLLDRAQSPTCPFHWTQALHGATGGNVIALDGKTARRSFRENKGLGALHRVTGWATGSGLTLGQVARAEKSDEITAIPERLRLLAVKGGTVTSDAMGGQKEIASQIRAQRGPYVLASKGNPSGLERDMWQLLGDELEADVPAPKGRLHEAHEKGHGRVEERTCRAVEIPADHPRRSIRKDSGTLVVLTSCRIVGGRETWETRLYISRHKPKAKASATAIRQHGSIEHAQHGRLDVTFGEDVRRQQDRTGAANLGAVRRLALGLLRQEKANKCGRKNKRLARALDPKYLLTVLANAKV
ncbi:MAG: ISAs1 family transposase [Gemmataceae bacterium]|nr:ISAs1 family transposase [Gemmataceae bacterium]